MLRELSKMEQRYQAVMCVLARSDAWNRSSAWRRGRPGRDADGVLGVDDAVDVGDRVLEDRRPRLARVPSDAGEAVAAPGSEAPADLFLVLAQDVDGEVPAVPDRRPGRRRVRHAHEHERRVERHGRERVRRHPGRTTQPVAGDNGHTRGEVPEDRAETGAVDAVFDADRRLDARAGRLEQVTFAAGSASPRRLATVLRHGAGSEGGGDVGGCRRCDHRRVRLSREGAGGRAARPFLHGFPDHGRTWTALLGDAAEAASKCVSPWIRGCPPTGVPADGLYQPAALSLDALAVADALALPRPPGGAHRARLGSHRRVRSGRPDPSDSSGSWPCPCRAGRCSPGGRPATWGRCVGSALREPEYGDRLARGDQLEHCNSGLRRVFAVGEGAARRYGPAKPHFYGPAPWRADVVERAEEEQMPG